MKIRITNEEPSGNIVIVSVLDEVQWAHVVVPGGSLECHVKGDQSIFINEEKNFNE